MMILKHTYEMKMKSTILSIQRIKDPSTVQYTKLQPLKAAILKFFDMLKNSNTSDEEFFNSSLNFITETRSILDYSLTDLRIYNYRNADVFFKLFFISFKR